MTEYFIVARSFAAPFVSDTSDGFVSATSPEDALRAFAAAYTHPAGLYAAACYADANAYHKGGKALAQWLSNHELGLRRAAKGKGAYSYLGHEPGVFDIDDTRVTIKNPREGRVVATNGE